MVSGADSISLVSVDSTKQHGAHVFDVNCRICTGSAENTSPPSLTFSQSNMPAGSHLASLPKDSDSSQDVGRSGQSFRKKIGLAQRLKMYSTELQKNSVCTANVLTDDKCISEKVNSVNMTTLTTQQNDGNQKPMDSFEDLTLNEPKVKADTVELHMHTSHTLQKESSVESENAVKQKLEESLALVHEKRHKDSSTSLLSDTAKQAVVSPFSCEKNLTAAGYVTVCCCYSQAN